MKFWLIPGGGTVEASRSISVAEAADTCPRSFEVYGCVVRSSS